LFNTTNHCPVILGCTNRTAINYNPEADVDDGSCEFSIGCFNDFATNYDPTAHLACQNDDCCVFESCGEPTAPLFGSFECEDEVGYLAGSSCTLTCSDNYAPDSLGDTHYLWKEWKLESGIGL